MQFPRDSNHLQHKKVENNERTELQDDTAESGSRGQQPDKNGALGGGERNESEQPQPERVVGRDGAHTADDTAGDRGVAGTTPGSENAGVDIKEARKKAFDNTHLSTEAEAKEALPHKPSAPVMTKIREIADMMMSGASRFVKAQPEDYWGSYYEKDWDYELEDAWVAIPSGFEPFTTRERIHFRPIGFDLLPEKFTMKELQSLYEAILDVKFDRANFAKKMTHFDLLKKLDETVWPTPKREANLYSFNKDSYNELKQKGFRLEF